MNTNENQLDDLEVDTTDVVGGASAGGDVPPPPPDASGAMHGQGGSTGNLTSPQTRPAPSTGIKASIDIDPPTTP